MPVSHGCCQKEAPTATNLNAPVRTTVMEIPVNLTVIGAIPSAILSPLQEAISGRGQQPANFLPQSPPSAISVLRI